MSHSGEPPLQPEGSQWTVLAHLLRPQGRKGELLAELHTDFPERFRLHPHVFLAAPDFSGPPSQARPLTIANFWLPVGRNSGRIVLAFTEVSSIEDAEPLAGLDVLTPLADRLELEPGAEYIDDLIGCTVIDCSLPATPMPIGTVQSVEFSTTPDGARRLPDVAPLLTVVTSGGNEILIPYVQHFLLSVDVTSKRIEISLPPGLLTLNDASNL